MKTTKSLITLLGASLLASIGSAQGNCNNPAPGPDVIVGSVSSVRNWGGTGGIGAYSLGTTSCNVGTAELNWFANNNQHPVIGQNMYRLKDGRFEQIGLSWLKHGFTALQQNLCCSCNSSGTGTKLGVGCSDPYGSGLNGSQGGLGPRFEVNAHSGFFLYPFTADGQSGNVIYKRIQVANTDLDPSQNAGALYFGEGHYIAPDDALAGNGNNNASYRQMTVTSFSGGAWSMNMSGNTQREFPAILAWEANDASVQTTNVQVPNEGLFIVASDCTDNGDGTWHYEYAVYNENSDASGGSFTVPVADGIAVTNIDFHDVDYHSGEPFSGTDWNGQRNTDDVTWATESFATNSNANAIRWGTLYNFRFDADAPPVGSTSATLGLFKPHTPSSVSVDVCGPLCGSVSASEVVRLGSPPNPNALLPGQTSGPVTGTTWDPVIDHTGFFPSAVTDFLAINPDGVQANVPLAIGTLLCNVPPGQFIFFSSPSTPFAFPIPDACDILGLAVTTQGGAFGGGQIELTNALDVVVGNQ